MVDSSWGQPPAPRGEIGAPRGERAAERARTAAERIAARATATGERLAARAAARAREAEERERARAAAQRHRGSGRRDVVREQRDTSGYAMVVDAARIRALAERGASVAGLAAVFGRAEEEIRRVLDGTD
ncbi:hypothetical protein [Sphingomonas sp. BK235]|uniref:hypothetical protein n=1 Tax=Sphingomonas sp. BK235 TaxID=2512131 RepID=UPI0010520FA5|nr:hypothetical protein [Sphingomonas sp. BK235]TCP30645.1 hypothetical protein EV292_1122 [Sphingomonas sp. BK235]